jgi:hypothetical protein
VSPIATTLPFFPHSLRHRPREHPPSIPRPHVRVGRPERRYRRWSLSCHHHFLPSSVSSPLWRPSSSSLTFSHPSMDPSSFKNPSPLPPVTGVPPPQPTTAAPKPFSAAPMIGHHGGFLSTSSCPTPSPRHTRARATSPAAPHLPVSPSRPRHRDHVMRGDRVDWADPAVVSLGQAEGREPWAIVRPNIVRPGF